VAPGRTGSFARLEPAGNAFTQALITVNPQVALNLRAMWDAANNRWNQWVLNYSQDKQFELLRNIGFEAPSWQDLSYLLIGIVVIVSLCGAAWTLWERSRQDPWLRLLQRAAQQLKHAGIATPPHATPRHLAELLKSAPLAAHYPVLPFTEWLLRLEQWRYSQRDAGTLAALQREFRQLQRPPRSGQP
jgi:hypothetical protein